MNTNSQSERAATSAAEDVDNPIAQLVALARQQGEWVARLEFDGRRLDAQEARLTELEEGAARRVAELAAENADLRATLVLANDVLRELKATCERYGWTEAAGPGALAWLEHVLGLGGPVGWPSVN